MSTLARAAGFATIPNALAQALAVAAHGGIQPEQTAGVKRWPDGVPITPTVPAQPDRVAPGYPLVPDQKHGVQPYNGDPFVGETPPSAFHSAQLYRGLLAQLHGSAQPGLPRDYGSGGVGPNAVRPQPPVTAQQIFDTLFSRRA